MGRLTYLSVCSGIEAATVAWHPLGWSPHAFAQFDPLHDYKRGPDFPSAVLAHHYGSNLPGEAASRNAPPNLGDITKFQEWPDASIDLLVGGTPCQSFSVAGLRRGLADPRGNLSLVYLAIADRYQPEWLVWENVPGVLSSSGGRDFGAFLGALAQLGYGFAWRVLDAQYVRVDGFGRAVPQRRRRVFVVGHRRDWRRAAAVFFERESLCGDSAPRRQAREDVAETIGASLARCSADDAERGGLIVAGGGIPDRSLCLNAGGMGRIDAETETLIPMRTRRGGFFDDDVAHSLRAEGFDASEDGTGRGTPLIPVIAPDIVAYDLRGREGGSQFEGPHDTANIRAASGGSSRSYVVDGWAVRRLMPVECERLQGFPDGYTDVVFRGKPAADGPRYKALGNSMAVNVMRWLGRRIDMVTGMP